MAKNKVNCSSKIYYKSGYKYSSSEDCWVQLPVNPNIEYYSKFISLNKDGFLKISYHYAWDGSTGVIDTKSSQFASLVHDALYQLMRNGILPLSYRDAADDLYYLLCIQGGMWWIVAKIRRKGLRFFGKSSTLSKNKRKILSAP